MATGLTKKYPHDCYEKEEESGRNTGNRVPSSFQKKKKYRNKRSISQRHLINRSTRSFSLPTISEEEEVPAVFFRDDANELPPLVGGTDQNYDYYNLPNNLFGNNLEDDLDDDLDEDLEDIAF